MYCKVVFDVPLDRDFDYAVPEELEALVRPGVRVTAPFGPRLTTGLITRVEQTPAFALDKIKNITHVLDERPVFGSDLFPLARFMKETWGGPIGQILFALVPPQAYFKLNPPPPCPALSFYEPSFALTEPQKQTLNVLKQKLDAGFFCALLSGPAGAGKTETVLRLSQEALSRYGQILITLPDVFAAQNFARKLAKRFGENVTLAWHSKMPLSQKKKIFSHISSGSPCVVVAARSGGLLPFKNLRLAVMLEEENDNYKQEENKPYFHLRDLLRCRAEQHEALFVRVSDTPSLETLHEKDCLKLELDQPIPGKEEKAQIKITAKKGERSAILSDFLLEQLRENLHEGHASLLILNRRGYANAYYCLNCGAYAKCKKCGAILAREKDEEGQDRLVCKKCGHKENMDQTCPQCQNKIFKSRGGGTQKVASEVAKLLPEARIVRLDSDTLKNKDGQGHDALNALERREADVVVGTRLALEAALSSRVTLAGVVDADLELDSPDFRASEKFGQLLFKLKHLLSTRPNGKLVVQASSPDIYPFESLHASYRSCAQEELLARESFSYPPFVRLVKVLVKSKDRALLDEQTARVLQAGAPFALEKLGPVKTGKKTDVLRKQYVLFKVSPEQFPTLVGALDALAPLKKTDFKLTADPYDFYS